MINKIKKILNKLSGIDFAGMAAEMAYNFLFALFPFTIFLISIFGLFGSEELVSKIILITSAIAPSDVLILLEKILNKVIQSSNTGLLTFAFIISIWSSSNAARIIIKSINQTYKIAETRSFWKIRLLSIAIVFVITIMLFILVNMIILGTVLISFIKNFITIPVNIENLLMLIRWPITIISLFIMTLFIYYVSPNLKNDLKIRLISALPGSIFFCFFWLLGSWLFSLYIENFGSYNETFGFLGGIMILLTWLYLSSFIILAGGAISSLYYKKRVNGNL